MTSFDLAAIFIGLVAAVAWLNAKVMRLPQGVAMLLAGLAGSLVLHVVGGVAPGELDKLYASEFVGRVNFPETVVGYMLAFLLFAGGMQVDLGEMRRRRLAILTLATLGVVASTVVVGFGVYAAAGALRLALPLGLALMFGALISPTDPVAVLAAVRGGDLAKSLQAVLQGEALFNDGVAIVMFTALAEFAGGGPAPDAWAAALALAREGLGGLALGLAGGLLVVRALRAIDDYVAEVALTIALAAGVYAIGHALGVSGPIAAVTAGMVVGDEGGRRAMSETTRRYVQAFWTLVDEILNALLFLLLGVEVTVLPFDLGHVGLWAVSIPLVLLARLATVLPWGAYFRFRHGERGPSLVLAWGGLRGALSLALALDAPPGPAHGLILSLTYAVVVFSVVVQGLSFGPLVRRLAGGAAETGASPQR